MTKIYNIKGCVQVEVYVDVEAESETEAIEKAKKLHNKAFEEGFWLTSPEELEVMK